ncbi:unnamed protein product [Trichobilharzia regenti]|nr:unnamed protein product [Trichobilharzia regenti]
MNLNEHFYIGGLPEPIRQINSFISPDVWSAQLRHDFVGCLGNFTVNKQLWDIDLESRSCWSKSSIKFGCTLSSSTNLCTDNTCTNNAYCLSNWNQSDCECTLTGKPCIKITSYLTDTRKQFSLDTEISSTKDNVFIGYLMTFLFNGVDFLRVAQNLNNDPSLYTWRGKIDITASESGMEPIYEMPISFNDLDSNINIQLKNPANGFTLQTRIKWKVSFV